MTACELRLKAVEVIQRLGWGTGDYQRADGRVCVIGALKIAAGVPLNTSDRAGVVGEAVSQITMHLRVPLERLWLWNDAADRTEAQVVEALKAGCP